MPLSQLGMSVFTEILKVLSPQPKRDGNVLNSAFEKTLIIDGKPKIHHTVDLYSGLNVENRVIRLKEEYHNNKE